MPISEDQLLHHIISMREEIAGISAKQDRMLSDMMEHIKQATQTKAELDRVQSDIDQARGSLRILQWLAGSSVVTTIVVMFVKSGFASLFK